MEKYIYKYPQWPDFTWKDKEIVELLGKVRHLQGKVLGQISVFAIQKLN